LPFSIAHLMPELPIPARARTPLPEEERPSIPPMPVVVHFHGGGFLSGSSAAHENYLRQWAIEVDCIIISVDYRLAPQFKFPIAIFEGAFIYNWLTSAPNLGVTVSRIAIVGDSAGGNIATAVTMKVIMDGGRKPDGLLLEYPALDACPHMTFSRIVFMNDPLVPVSASAICAEAYLSTDDNLRDPLISPLYASADLLRRMPPTIITAAQFDPLCDDAVSFWNRLRKVGVPVRFKMYQQLPHGFLSLKNLLPEAGFSISESSDFLKCLLSDNPSVEIFQSLPDEKLAGSRNGIRENFNATVSTIMSKLQGVIGSNSGSFLLKSPFSSESRAARQ